MTDTDHRFRGPRGQLHLPRWSQDCWRGRPSGCCWLCQVRLWATLLRGVGR